MIQRRNINLNNFSAPKLILQSDKCINLGINYILKKYNPKIGWSDFSTNRSGESTSWITAFILAKVGQLLPQDIVKDSVKLLLSQQQNGESWGFSSSTPPDCDSTVHAVNAILLCNNDKMELSNTFRFIKLHLSQDGGFRTYNDTKVLRTYRKGSPDVNYNGWTQPHECVTAVALNLIDRKRQSFLDINIDKIQHFLLAKQTNEGYWKSYWWKNKYFATSDIIQKSNLFSSSCFQKATQRAFEWMMKNRSCEGYWDNGYDLKKPCIVSTAKCINTILSKGLGYYSVDKSVWWLTQQQKSDGSWRNLPVFRIPPTHIIEPDSFSSWKVGGRGVSSCTSDNNHIYTTVSVVEAIHNLNCRLKNDFGRI